MLKSWAVTKAPSRDTSVKRLAVEVEDHPLDYGAFEGTIPAGNYGAGTVQMWDRGTWEPQEPDLDAAFAKGQIKMVLHGERLKGKWALIRLKSDRGKPSKRSNWLLIKEKRRLHRRRARATPTWRSTPRSSRGRTLAEIAERREGMDVVQDRPTRKAPPKPKPTKAAGQHGDEAARLRPDPAVQDRRLSAARRRLGA